LLIYGAYHKLCYQNQDISLDSTFCYFLKKPILYF
jgi:hypothetical protein